MKLSAFLALALTLALPQPSALATQPLPDTGNRVLGGGEEETYPERPRPDPATTIQGIYQPWSGTLKNLKKSLRADRSYVIWLNVPAQHPLDLRTGDNFRKWILATPETEMSISHQMIAWRCRADNGQMYEAATGITGEESKQSVRMINAGFGISTFLTTFTDGRLQPAAEVEQYVAQNHAKRGAVYTGFEVDDRDCRNMSNFVLDFAHHRNSPMYNYGSLVRPGKFEGGGCVTFASELMNKAGLLRSVIPSFFRQIQFREDLMGGNIDHAVNAITPPATPWLKGRTHTVSKLKLVSSAWKYPGFKMQTMAQMDPELMLYVTKQFADHYVAGLSADARKKELAAYAATPLAPRTTTGKELFTPRERTPINDDYAGMAKIRDLTVSYIRAKKKEGFQVKRVWTNIGMPAFILEKDR